MRNVSECLYGQARLASVQVGFLSITFALIALLMAGTQAFAQNDAGLPASRGTAALDVLKERGEYDALAKVVQNSRTRDASARTASPSDAYSLRATLTPSYTQPDGLVGLAVAVDGSTAVVGAPLQAVGASLLQGNAYIFVRYGNRWVEQAALTAPDGASGDEFGTSVAVSGETVIVGAWHADLGASSNNGAAYIYTRSGTDWNLQLKLIPPDSGAGDNFGESVSIDGVTAVIGSRRGSSGFEAAGAAYVYVKGTIWTLQQKLVSPNPENGIRFASDSLAIDGDTLVVGAPASTDVSGTVYIFTRSGSTWSLQQTVTSPDPFASDRFGFSVGVSGESIIIGAYGGSQNPTVTGKAYVFKREGFAWLLQQELTAEDVVAGDRFGVSVGISGETAIVGIYPNPLSNPKKGAAYIFSRSGNTWNQQQKLTPENSFDRDAFGRTSAISGEIAVVGAPTTVGGIDGSAYVFGSYAVTGAGTEKIAFSSDRDGNNEIYVMNPDGSGLTRMTNNAGSDLHPSFSGDGSQIAFTSNRDGNTEIYVMNADGSNVTRLTNNASSDSQPNVSRSGLKIVFSSDRDGNDEIYSMNADGTNQTRLTNSAASDTNPSFSPAGSRIIYESDGAAGNRDIFIMNANGSGQTRLTTAAGTDSSAVFSRDGTKIAFASARNGNNEIYTMNPDGTTQTRITNNAASDSEPGYSPDGTKIIFETDRDSNREIYTMNADGTNTTRLTNDPAIDSAPDWGGAAEITASGGRITSSDGLAVDFFGSSVAISGSTAVVGAIGDDFGSNFAQGSAYIFVKTGGVWVEQQKIFADDGADGDQFGYSVAISGETVIVGALTDNVGGNTSQGSAYVFVRNGTSWTQQQKIVAADGAGFDSFGISVAVDGQTAIVGCRNDDIAGNNNQGSTYVFVRSGTTWTQQQLLSAADGAAEDAFGSSVAISGNTAVVGSVNDDVGSNFNQGSAYVFVRNGTTWSQQQQLSAADGAVSDGFGLSVGITGETVVIGSPFDDIGTNADQGSAYIFVRNGTTWTQQQKLTSAEGAANDNTGWSVGISGETAVVGAHLVDLAATNQGVAYTFVRNGSAWTQFQKLAAPNAATNDNFGKSVAISGEYVISGAPNKAIGTSNQQGAAYTFTTALAPGRAVGDFDGDGRTDLSVFRNSDTTFYLKQSRDGLKIARFGLSGDMPVPGDYDGDGRADIAVFRPDTDPTRADFFVLNSGSSTVTTANWGLPGDKPVAGDFNGDGRADFALYRQSDTRFYILTTSGVQKVNQFGVAGDIPMGIDFDGDGTTQIAVFRPSNTTWYIAKQSGIASQNFDAIVFGGPTDIPVVTDYDGDDLDDLAVFRSGVWFVRQSTNGLIRVTQFGSPNDMPVTGDYDGDGKSDLAVYRGGLWWILRSLSGSATVEQFGLPSDKPLEAAYLP